MNKEYGMHTKPLKMVGADKGYVQKVYAVKCKKENYTVKERPQRECGSLSRLCIACLGECLVLI